jgi:hypothetical protein
LDGLAILSGGINIPGWKKATAIIPGLPIEAKGKVWVADAPVIGNETLNFRQLWVNNVKATRARDVEAPLMNRILSWDKKTETCWMPKPKIWTSANIERHGNVYPPMVGHCHAAGKICRSKRR